MITDDYANGRALRGGGAKIKAKNFTTEEVLLKRKIYFFQ